MKPAMKNSIPILSRVMGASDANYLNPKSIYSLNRVLQELLDELQIKLPMDASGVDDEQQDRDGDTHAWVDPYFFDHCKRTWHFALVRPEVWAKGKAELSLEVLWLLARIATDKKLKRQYKNVEHRLLAGLDYAEAYKFISGQVERVNKGLLSDCSVNCHFKQNDGSEVDETFKKFVEDGCSKCLARLLDLSINASENNSQHLDAILNSLMLIYHGLPNHRATYLPGIFYRALLKRRDVVWSHLDGIQIQGGADPYAVTGRMVELGGSADSDYQKIDQFESSCGDVLEIPKREHWPNFRALELGLAFAMPFYLSNMLVEDLKEEREVFFLLMPIHDVWVGSVGYGGLWGALLCTFPTEEQKNDFENKKLDRLRKMCEVLADELAMSALATVSSLPIKPPYDLVEHFIKVILHMQDWERVSVFRGQGQNKTLLYRYGRSLDQSGLGDGDKESGELDFSLDFSWERCDCTQTSECQACRTLGADKKDCLTWEPKDQNDRKIWSRQIMPELSEDEEHRFGDIILEFDYPETAVIPQKNPSDDDHTHELFELAVIRQQIEVLRALIPKVQTRRAALRTAVSAIMGRNMSHNIGSHVLARYSSLIKKDLDRADKDHTDHRTDFLSYLQRRMDFLAEVATSDRAFWEQPLSLSDALINLNYDEQAKRIMPDGKKKDNPKTNIPILLSYISGNESLKASVELGAPNNEQDDSDNAGHERAGSYFSCPGGEVGAHALYVILENIIRNSSRHAKSQAGDVGKVEIHVVVHDKSDGETEGKLIKLTIIDPRTRLDVSGWVVDDEKQIGDGSLIQHLNDILEKERFLNEDGSTNPKYWGIREMQICAHYLRGFPLGDLEGEAKSPPVLKAVLWPHNSDQGEYFLSYTLYLKRAHLLAYVEIGGKTQPSDAEKKTDVKKDQDDQLLRCGVKPIYVDNLEEVDWSYVSKKSRGYSFLVLSKELMSKFQEAVKEGRDSDTLKGESRQSISKHALPVRTINMPSNDIAKTVGKAVSSKNNNWMQPLHNTMISTYRTNGEEKSKRWGKGNVYIVPAWKENEQRENKKSDESNIIVWSTTLDSNETYRPFCSLPDFLPQLQINKACKNIGLAWLDHPNVDDLMTKSGGCTESASFPYESGARNWASVEPLWSDSSHTPILKRCTVNGSIDSDLSELAAAALARVIVLDERIQSRRHDDIRSVTLYKYWPQVGVWCPLHPDDVKKSNNEIIIDEAHAFHDKKLTCNLDEPDFESINAFLKKPTNLDYQLPVDFLVIHLNILERLNQQRRENEHPNESINKTSQQLQNTCACVSAQLIVVTGRGVPTVARHLDGDDFLDARYLPISALLEFLVTRPSKLGLMRVLWAASALEN